MILKNAIDSATCDIISFDINNNKITYNLNIKNEILYSKPITTIDDIILAIKNSIRLVKNLPEYKNESCKLVSIINSL